MFLFWLLSLISAFTIIIQEIIYENKTDQKFSLKEFSGCEAG